MFKLRQAFSETGALRLGLFAIALASLVLEPAPGTSPVASGVAMIPTFIVPILAPVVFVALLLDAFMSRLMASSETPGPKRQRLRRLGWAALAAAVVLAVFWTPYFRALA